MTLGNKIAILRKKQGMTQEALAQKLEVTNQAVSKWESDTCCPDIALLPKLADIFGVTLDALFDRAPAESPDPEQQEAPAGDILSRSMKTLGLGMEVLEKVLGSKNSKNHFHVTVEGLEQEAKEHNTSPKFQEVDWSKFDVSQGDWEDDGILRVVLFAGRKIIMGSPIVEQVTFRYNGPAQTIYSQCNVVCDSVEGHVYAGGDVTCDDVGGDIHAQGSITCDCIEGNVTAKGTVTCDEINGATVRTEHDIECDELNDCTVYVSGDLRCEEVNSSAIEYKGSFSTN